MFYTGIDLHKKTSFLTTVDESGKTVSKKNIMNDEKAILEYLEALDEQARIVIESTASWYWLYDLLTASGFEVVISNPVKTKAIASAKIKNDRVDSHMLAQLLRADLIPTVYVSPLQLRKLKELIRHRQRLVNDTTRMKNRIHALLRKNNKVIPFSDLFGVQGLDYLQQVQLPEYHRDQLQSYLPLYQELIKQIQPLTETIYGAAKDDPIAKLLMSVPGIGAVVAMTIVAEVGDISRFRSYRNLASYAGLVPSLDASGGKQRMGSITKQGSRYLRTALVEAAHVIPRMKRCRLNPFFRRRIVRGGYRKAIVATAHKILKIVYYVWKNQTPYQETYPVCA
jgi:transposase